MPTAAEWEYAARAGTTDARSGALEDVAWYLDNANERTHPVGERQANAWGLYDMLGNVWEWVWDGYGDDAAGAATDPLAHDPSADRVVRGGSWATRARDVRAAHRDGYASGLRYSHVGFRLSRSLP